MRRVPRTIATVAAVALLAAGCGGGSGSGSNSGSGAGNTPEAGSLDGQSIEVAAVWTGAEQAAMEKVLKAFSDQTGAKVTFTSTGDDIATVLGTRITGGDAPDVAVLPQPGLLKQFVADGSLKPVSADVADAVDANYGGVWKQLATVDGQLYGVWFKAANKSTVWYNTTLFDQAGASPPTDFDGLATTAATIADSGVTPISVAGADGWTLTDWFENVYLRVAGPDKYDQLTAHEIPWTDESVKSSLQDLGNLWGTPNTVVGGAKGALQMAFPDSVTAVFGDNPSGAIVYEGDFVAGVISDSTSAQVGDTAQFFPFPSIAGSPASVVGGGDVAVALSDSPAAMALLQYLATPEAAEIWAAIGGYVSPNQNLDTGVYADDTTRQIAEALIGSGDNFRFDMSDQMPPAFGGTPGAGEWKILQDFLADPTSVDATAQALEDAAAKAFGG